MNSARSSAAEEAFAALLRAWNGGDPEAVRNLVTDDYVGHMLHVAGGERGRDEYPGWIERWRALNPDAHFAIEQQIESGDWVASRLRAVREERGVAQVAFGMNFSRCADGRIAEEWAIWSEWRTA
jgi:predicted SnoaL-like aldol condensation-catalyzing enzyme